MEQDEAKMQRCKSCGTYNDAYETVCKHCKNNLKYGERRGGLLPEVDVSPKYEPDLLMPPLSGVEHETDPLPSGPKTKRRKGISRRTIINAGVAVTTAAILGGAGLYFISKRDIPAITIQLTHSSDKTKWLQGAIEAFNSAGKTFNDKYVEVVLDERASLDAKNMIINGTIHPTIWSPGSSLEVAQLKQDWQQQNPKKADIVSGSSASLVNSPIVFAVWQERAKVLQQKYGSIDWPMLALALRAKDWDAIGGSPDWGAVKFGQTRPDTSSTGLLTIILLAYAFQHEEKSLTALQVNDPKFLNYFREIEGAVTQFGVSTATFFERVVLIDGPSAYDIIATAENVLLTNQALAAQHNHQQLQLFYPHPTILSDHPFAILQTAPAEQRDAAGILRAFLLEAPQQRLALQYGLRPAITDISVTEKVDGNLFLRPSQGQPILSDLPSLAQSPAVGVMNNLITMWKKYYDDVPQATG